MTLEFINHLIQGAVNYNAQITLIILSGLVLIYTIIASGLRQEWARYAFLILIGIGLYVASMAMTSAINHEFFNSLSTELFGAAITLVILGKWMMPSLWWLVILAPLVIISELFIYRIHDAATQSYYLGISSNIWGAFLVAILLEELVHKRNEQGKGAAELISRREKIHRKNLTLDLEIAELEKQVSEASLQKKELHKQRLQLALESMRPTGWDIEIKVYGRNPQDLQNQILRVQQMTHVVHTSDVYKHSLGERCHCYVKASASKPPLHTNGTGTWAALSASALQEELQEGK